ncbi:hypothetical protein [Nocardia sp. XZ_19_385]|uniref:hypothetical protein n=1 Tax=Nocardia sp. XZ_19_385 TaxID=2769488 RepID=UPI00188DF0A8|nr:hypothetical protein [Nocardia sp. XZ_19_385]
MTEPFPTSAEDMKAIMDRLTYRDDEAVAVPVVTGQDTGRDLVPRSVKLPNDLDSRCKARALRLGLSQSAYIRSLIERDLAQTEHHDRPVMWSDLARIVTELSRTA